MFSTRGLPEVTRTSGTQLTILRRQHSHGKPGQIINSTQVLLSLQLVAGAGSCFDRKSDIPCQVRSQAMNEIDILSIKYFCKNVMISDNDNVRCVGTRPVGSTMEFPLVTAAEDSSSGAFGGWRPGECGHGNWIGGWGSCFLFFCHVSHVS